MIDHIPIRCAVIGMGEIGQKHIRALSKVFNVRVLAVCDPSEFSYEIPEEARVYYSAQELVESEQFDIVILATPPKVTTSLFALYKDFPGFVLAEKPVVLSSAALSRIVSYPIAARSFVGFQTHFAPGVRNLLKREDVISDSSTKFSICLTWRRDDAYYRGWRAKKAEFGGVLYQQVIHSLALADLLIPSQDEPIDFECKAIHSRPWKETEDAIHALVRFKSGREIQLNATVSATGAPSHVLKIDRAGHRTIVVAGKNLELGVDPHSGVEMSPPPEDPLRVEMLASLKALVCEGTHDPRLYCLQKLPRVIKLIEQVYEAELR